MTQVKTISIRNTDERQFLYNKVREKHAFLPKTICSKAIDRILILILEKTDD